MALDISPLAKAVARLREGVERYNREKSDTQIRDGLIQRFEFTYELSHKMLKRYLAETSANPAEYAEISFADLIRDGCAKGMLKGDWPAWRTYRDMRARTSHTYDEDVAAQVVAGIEGFLSEAEYLLERLRDRG